jgi:chitin-binding protein
VAKKLKLFARPGLTYQWSVTAPSPALYTLSNNHQRTTTLTLADPSASANVAISLVVTSASRSDSATVTLVHRPAVASPWFDLGPLTNAARTLAVGNRTSIRAVLSGGQDLFFPSTPLVITSANAAAASWPFELAQAVNAQNGSIRIGVVNAQNQVTPVRNATSNRIYALISANVTGAFLQVAPAAASCRVDYQIANQWASGFQASVSVINTSSLPVVGYTLTWTMGSGEAFSSGWNATFLASGRGLTASNTAGQWNGVITPNGGSSSFGYLGSKGAQAAVIPIDFRLHGEPCSNSASVATALTNRSLAPSAPVPPVHTCSQATGSPSAHGSH